MFLCRNRDERECLTNFGFNTSTLSENIVFDSNMMMNVTRTLNYLDVVPTPLRLSSLYYKIYVLALNSLFASLIPFASLIYMNFCTVIGKYHFEICSNWLVRTYICIPSALRKMKRQSTQINETENTLLKTVRSVRKVSVYYSHSPTCNGVKNVTGRRRSVFTSHYLKFSIVTVLTIYSFLNFVTFNVCFE